MIFLMYLMNLKIIISNKKLLNKILYKKVINKIQIIINIIISLNNNLLSINLNFLKQHPNKIFLIINNKLMYKIIIIIK